MTQELKKITLPLRAKENNSIDLIDRICLESSWGTNYKASQVIDDGSEIKLFIFRIGNDILWNFYYDADYIKNKKGNLFFRDEAKGENFLVDTQW